MTSPEVAVESAPSLASTDAGIWDADTTPDAASPAEQAAPAAPATQRDDQGRFASPDKAPPTEAPAEEQAPESPPAESTDEQPPAEALEAEEQPEAEAVYPEFEYTVNGRALNIPGSKVGADGLFIPASQQEQTSRLLIAGRMAEQQRRNHGRELQAARNEGQVEVQKARKLIAAFGELTKDKGKLLDWAGNLEKNRETLMLRAELDAVKAEKDQAGKQWTERDQTEKAQALVPQLQNGLRSVLAQHAAKPEFAGVDTAKLYERIMQRHFDQVFEEVEPTDDNPEGILIDVPFIREEMQYEAAAIQRGRTEAQRSTTQAALTKENAARQGQSGTKPPPMVGTGKGSQTAGTKPKTYKSTREADADIWG